MGAPVGDNFQKETKYIRNQGFGGNMDWSNKPETYQKLSTNKIVSFQASLTGQMLSSPILTKDEEVLVPSLLNHSVN